MSNKGFEMTVTGIPIETKDFSWDVTFNFSRNRNKVKSILGIDADGDGREDDLISDKIFINIRMEFVMITTSSACGRLQTNRMV